jgi:hypothetical protein
MRKGGENSDLFNVNVHDHDHDIHEVQFQYNNYLKDYDFPK